MISPEQLESYVQSEDQISARLITPLVLTYLDTEKINFERSKSGFWGWGGEKTEDINGYTSKVSFRVSTFSGGKRQVNVYTKVFGANNVELVTKTRTEHMTEEDKQKAKSNKNPLQSFLGMAEVEVKQAAAAAADKDKDKEQQPQTPEGGGSSSSTETFSQNNPCRIGEEEYFDAERDLGKGRDIGRPKEMTCKVQKFQAQLWLCEEYPLSLQEQVRYLLIVFHQQ